MSQWFRVFGVSEIQPEPAAILEHLRGLGVEADGHFRGDDQGWFAADIGLVQGEAPLQLERFLSTEEGIRAELNTWAAWLETCDYSPNSQKLMEHVVPSDMDPSKPISIGEETYNTVCLRDLQNDREQHRSGGRERERD